MSFPQPAFLCVEGDGPNREDMQLIMIRMMGFADVTFFENTEDFMERLRSLSTPPDVVFVSLDIEPHNGYDILTMLREDDDFHRARVIAMSTRASAVDVDTLESAGFDGLISKPIVRHLFPALLQRILAGETVWFSA